MRGEEFLEKHTPKKQRLVEIFIKNKYFPLDKKELMDRTGLKENTLNQYLKELRKEGVIDSIKFCLYGSKKLIAEWKENPKKRKI